MDGEFIHQAISINRLSKNDRRIQIDVSKVNNQGQILMRCNPLAYAVRASYQKKICYVCFKEGELQRCSQCCQYYYCSKECQMKDWTNGHKKECKYVKEIYLSQQKNNPQQLIPCNIMLLLRIYLNEIDIKDFIGDIDSLNETQKQDYNQIAVVLLKHIKGVCNADEICYLMNLQAKIQFNCFTILETEDVNQIAIGLYTPANFFDHRCQRLQNMSNEDSDCANCTFVFQKTQLIVFTNNTYVRQSKNGKNILEATISYINEGDRQRFLQEQYAFQCKCDRCKHESLNSCKEYLISKQSEGSDKDLQVLSQKFIDKKDYVTFTELIKWTDQLIDSRFQDALQHLYLYTLQEKQFKQSFKVLKIYINNMQFWLDCDSHPFIGWRLNEASKLCFHLNYLLKAEQYAQQAIKQLRIFYSEGNNLDQYKQLQIRLNDIQSEIKMQKDIK